ncbi:hypothetical protein M2459_002716 [Parabacteroides sp. PF5-5]|nr:hypothetical protein [Parabacteroides sp. PH5-39]MDH6316856.1 hypothetical protein [Parabacteroides sp. PF5-13]MDH6320641.1 hypothetical protein [Parabacteroides sp. PH5-13]MDH6324438.1 hypothetical protein [Parabacteroides sp. PH5-8]MDH6328041.1 hypothetical protein [Parabacteroides sp. PH5-41]MDH6335951.1 hypothetical protein [Parabacteroides sp. PF5-5]MDH6346907.1 hypothetical protein [Parabacteroides sp. PH5-46]MDH6361869.1 hypothetical protein [Parabacteroides sp. PH5-16]MDH6377537.
MKRAYYKAISEINCVFSAETAPPPIKNHVDVPYKHSYRYVSDSSVPQYAPRLIIEENDIL